MEIVAKEEVPTKNDSVGVISAHGFFGSGFTRNWFFVLGVLLD